MSTGLVLFVLLVVLVLANFSLEFIARWRNPPIGQFLDINGVRLHYVCLGDPDALTLVMLHGNGTLLQDFSISGLAAAASNSFRVICFDRPGFGHSSRPRAVIWSPGAPGRALVRGAGAAWHRARAGAWPFLGRAGRPGHGTPQQREGERACTDFWILFPNVAI